MGDWEGMPNWCGGWIQFRLRLEKCESGGGLPFRVIIERPESRKSNRFARFLGSRACEQLRVPDALVNKERDAVQKFLKQKFVLLGRVFVPYASKDGKIYLAETSEDYERRPDRQQGDHLRHSFRQFVSWHNPLELNSEQVRSYAVSGCCKANPSFQPSSKWVTRFHLGLSTSRPVLQFKEEHMYYIEDRAFSYCLINAAL